MLRRARRSWAIQIPIASIISTATPTLSMAPQAIGASGQGQPHDNMQPYLVLLFCIALQGVYPPRS